MTAVCDGCKVEWYDFQFYKKSNPPAIDAEPVVLPIFEGIFVRK